MNTRDLAETKAAELLRDMHVAITPDRLRVATRAFLQGWVHGLQDAQRVTQRGLTCSDAQTDEQIRAGFEHLRRLASPR